MPHRIKKGSAEYKENIRKQKILHSLGYIKAQDINGSWGTWQNKLYNNLSALDKFHASLKIVTQEALKPFDTSSNKEITRTPTLRRVADTIAFPAKHIVHKLAEPAVSAAQDVIRHNITVPTKKKLGMQVTPQVKTENDYSNSFLNTLDSINISQLDKQVPDWRARTARGDAVRIGVNGKDYINNYGGTHGRTFIGRITDPLQQIETTLGSYNVQATDNDITTTDTYDYNTNIHLNPFTLYGAVRNLMNYVGTPDSAPDNEKIKVNIKSKRRK